MGDQIEEIYSYWGSLGDSIMSLFWSITGGQDWADLINPLVGQTENQLHNIIYSMFIAFSTMVVMNLVTGVFVDGAQRLSKEDRDRELLKMAYKIFNVNVVDLGRGAEVSEDLLDSLMREGKMDGFLKAVDLQRRDGYDLFKMLDEDEGGTISL